MSFASDPFQSDVRSRDTTSLRFPLWRSRPSVARLLRGGRLADAGRVPRYLILVLAGLGGIWTPITVYLASAPPSYTSHMSLILPGSGASSSVNLANIGQASTHANSAFASSAISPTETYKRLLSADRVVRAAATLTDLDAAGFGKPKVMLVDQTAFIHVKMSAGSALAAREKNAALLSAFMAEIDRLRGDEQDTRASGGLDAIRDYRDSISHTRAEIDALRRETGLQSAAQYDRLVNEADVLRVQIETLRATLDRKRSATARLEKTLDLDAPTAAQILRLNGDETYVALTAAVANAAADVAAARARFGPRHPSVQTAVSAYETAKSEVAARSRIVIGADLPLERVRDGAGRGVLLAELVRHDTERRGVATELLALETQLEHHDARLRALSPLAAQLEDLQRDFDVAEAVFASAIARTQSQRTDIYASYPLVQVLEDPTLPDAPSSPNKKLAIAAGLAATLFLVITLTLAWSRQSIIDSLTREPRRS
mgnify:CR=1 FL=1